MLRLVVKDAEAWFLRGTGAVDVGWRMKCKDGDHDQMWGNLSNKEQLLALLPDIISKFGECPEVIDETTERASPGPLPRLP